MSQIDLVKRIAMAAKEKAGQAYIVGGAVRDQILGEKPKDLDIEMYRIPEDKVEPFIRGLGLGLSRVGRSFPVWKVWEHGQSQAQAVDLALPRSEVLVGPNRTDFSITFDPKMTPRDAASRRDFTINSMMLDPLTGEIIDPFGGQEDLRAGILRHTSDHFSEDPLRVLRGAQFCARFNLTPAPETVELCRKLSPSNLSPERLMEEWGKLITKSVKPSQGLDFLQQVDWLKHTPELLALIGVQQDPVHHPEGDAWTHTKHCMDAFAEQRLARVAAVKAGEPDVVAQDPRETLIVGLAVLCHDLGKATHTTFSEGAWHAYGHETAGVEPTRAFLGRMTADAELVNHVSQLVAAHMEPKFHYKSETEHGQDCTRAYRRLAAKVPSLDMLAQVCWCDMAGRPPLPKIALDAEHLRKRAKEIGVTHRPAVRLLQGRDLIKAGYKPGPYFGPILDAAYEAQLNAGAGEVFTQGDAWKMALTALAALPEELKAGVPDEAVLSLVMKREAAAAQKAARSATGRPSIHPQASV